MVGTYPWLPLVQRGGLDLVAVPKREGRVTCKRSFYCIYNILNFDVNLTTELSLLQRRAGAGSQQ